MNIFQRATASVKKALNRWSTFDHETANSWTNWWNGRRTRKSTYELLGEYKDLVYACIVAIAEDVAKYEPVFYRKDLRTGKRKTFEHPFLKVLRNPNPYTSQFELFEATISYKLLNGDAFWYLAVGERTRQAKEIYMLRPDRIQISVDQTTGRVSGYLYTTDAGNIIPLETDEVIHFKDFNPRDRYRGIGKVQAGLLYIDTENITSEFQYNFMNNSATPSGVVTLNGNITKEGFDKAKDDWREQYSGTNNAGKTLMIRNMEASFTKVGLAMNELDMKNLKDITEERVLKIFRVPKAILGETDSVGLGKASVETAEYIFAKRVIDPEQTRFDDIIRAYVSSAWKEKELYVDHVSQIPQDEEAQLAEDDKAVDRWVTRNEIRARKGLLPIKGGDELYVNFNQMTLTQEPEPQKTLTLAALKTIKKQGTQAFLEVVDSLEDKGAGQYQRNLKKLLNAQQKLVVTEISKLTGKKLKTLQKQEVTLQGLGFTLSFTPEEIELNLLAVLLRTLVAAAKAGIDYTGKPELEFILEQATRNSIFDSTDRLMKSFNEETALKIQKQLAAGLSEGENITQLKARIESIYEEAKGFRAERIARTEAHRATNEGIAKGYLTAGYSEMVWRTRGDSCIFCKTLEGTVTRIGTPFLNKGSTVTSEDGKEYNADYDDVRYADLHPNCDCYLEPVIN